MIVLLLVAGQTIIFLLRLVAADRRTRRRPLGSATKTVGEIEDEAPRRHRPRPRRRRRRERSGRGSRDRADEASGLRATKGPCDNRPAPVPDRRRPQSVEPPEEARRRARARDLLLRSPRPGCVLQVLHEDAVRAADAEYGDKYGIRFLGWYNVAHGWDFDNVILLELPDYATLDKLEADEGIRAIGHRAGEWIFQRHHSMFLRERMGPDLEFHG